MPRKIVRDPPMQKLIDDFGLAELSRRVGLNPNSVIKWKRVPDHRIVEVERVTGVKRERLRPDLYRKPPRRRREAVEIAA